MSFFEGLAKEEFYLVFLWGDEYTSAIFFSSFSLLLSFLTKRSDFTKKKDGKYTTTYSFSNNNNKKKIYARSRYQKRLWGIDHNSINNNNGILFFFYSSEHVAPAATIFAIIASASAFERPFFKTHGAPSTKSFASFNPSSVAARTSLMTLIFELASKASSLRETVSYTHLTLPTKA